MGAYKPRPLITNMPTLVLLDKSLSMKRPVSNEEPSITRLSLAKDGIDTLFTYLETVFPSEYVGLMSFSSTCELVSPFTKDYNELREALETIAADDRTDFSSAMQFMTETVIKEWGVFAPIQAILVTDGLLGISVACEQYCFPFPCQFNVLFLTTKEEMSIPSLSNQLDLLSKAIEILPANVTFLSGSKLSLDATREAFVQLTRNVFYPYNGTLKCGHLQCNFTLSPSPRMVHTTSGIATDPKHRFTNPYNVVDFPTELNVCGFLEVNTTSAPAVYSKHFLIDNEFTQRDVLDKLLKNLQSGNEEPSSVEEEDEKLSGKPSFRVLLHGSLKCEGKVAVIQLGYGIHCY